jgi:hypothetical protein
MDFEEYKAGVLRVLNKMYGASFEATDFDALYKLVEDGLDISYMIGYQHGWRQPTILEGVKEII